MTVGFYGYGSLFSVFCRDVVVGIVVGICCGTWSEDRLTTENDSHHLVLIPIYILFNKHPISNTHIIRL